jgi:ubiquinone/menaquinone biosynthesis C-methylase UbiE
MSKYNEELLEKEREFHDQWANEIDLSKINVSDYFETSTSPENRFIVEHMGDLNGKYLLDIGCGAGENSVYFALKGARCIATDYSPGMLVVAEKLAAMNNVKIETNVVDAMNIPYPDNTFDIVYIANTLHHVDTLKCIDEIFRVLKPGGKMCSWDPLRHNPVINVYRRMATDVRTEDEYPLHINIVKHISKKFSDVKHDTFWFSTLWIFLRFYLIERVHPNKERYWKKIIYEEKRLRKLYLRLERFDKLIKKIPFMKRFAWNIAIVATK